LATIIACTYSVLHLSIPEQRAGRDPGWRGDIKWFFKHNWGPVKWTISTTLLPEYILGRAAADYIVAWRELAKLHKNVPETKKTVTMTHFLFAAMGGLVVTASKDKLPATPEVRTPRPSTPRPSSVGNDETRMGIPFLTEDAARASGSRSIDRDGRSFELNSYAENNDTQRILQTPTPSQQSPALKLDSKSETNSVRLFPTTLRFVLEERLITSELPSQEEIMDRSKSDMFGKFLTMVQIGYFIVEMIVRQARDLAISQLEIGVAGFVACSFFTYFFCLNKPKAVNTTFTIHDFGPEGIPQRVLDVQRDSAPESSFSKEDWSRFDRPFRNDATFGENGTLGTGPGFIILTIASVPMGAIHIIAWNYLFPSFVDLTLWRVAAVLSTATVFLFLIVAEGVEILDRRTFSRWHQILGMAILIALIVAYFGSRLVLMVEMFRCLFFLPPEAFVTTWTANIPHIG
jgi:hypothetical protein